MEPIEQTSTETVAETAAPTTEAVEESGGSIGDVLRSAFDDDADPEPTEEVDTEALDKGDDDAGDGEDSDDEDDSESEDSEKDEENEKDESAPKKETPNEKRRRKLREANERAEVAETRVQEADARASEAAGFLAEAEKDLEAYEAFALSERARSTKLMEILAERDVRLTKGELAMLELAGQNATTSAQKQISESQKQASAEATKTKEAETKQWASEIRRTSDTWAEALNIPQDVMRKAIVSAFQSRTLKSASDVGQIAKALAAQAAAAAAGANGTEARAAPNGQIKLAPRTIKPTNTTQPSYKKGLGGWKQSILDDPSI